LARIIQEAMAVGVIASEVGGVPEILENGENGLSFEPGNSHQLASCVEQLLTDPGLGERLAQAGHRTVVDQFDIRRTVSEIERYLQGVCQSQPIRASGSANTAYPVELDDS
jgi:glycosyltransferase involved in cell wall biosynthesis